MKSEKKSEVKSEMKSEVKSEMKSEVKSAMKSEGKSARVVHEAVTIPARDGSPMYGVLSRQDAHSARPAVIFCHAGVQAKTGTGDVLRWLAASLAAEGVDALRFDQTGTGDSPGEVASDIPVNEYFRKVQSGAFREATEDAVRWIERACAPSDLILFGICGGCVSAVMTAAAMPDAVSGLVLFTPPVLYSPHEEMVRSFDAAVAGRKYIQKLFDPRAYGRLFAGQSDYQLIRAAVASAVEKVSAPARRMASRLDRGGRPNHPSFNQHFWEAFRSVAAYRVPTLFLLAALDNETRDFNVEFKEKVLDKGTQYAAFCSIRTLAECDHALMFEQARREAFDVVGEWIRRQASPRAAA
jgi:pimeloyl-ACP methyl ester carboxylesterase